MTVRDIFDSMAYGPAPESSAEALAWIGKHKGRFGHWIDGAFTKRRVRPSTPATPPRARCWPR